MIVEPVRLGRLIPLLHDEWYAFVIAINFPHLHFKQINRANKSIPFIMQKWYESSEPNWLNNHGMDGQWIEPRYANGYRMYRRNSRGKLVQSRARAACYCDRTGDHLDAWTNNEQNYQAMMHKNTRERMEMEIRCIVQAQKRYRHGWNGNQAKRWDYAP
jgi:hypothetical protein